MASKITSAWGAELQLRFMQALRSKLEAMVGDDEEVIRDTLEGEVDVDGAMETLIRMRNERLAMAKARRDLSRSYTEAARTDETQVLNLEGLVFQSLQAAGVDKWKGAAGTAYIRTGAWSTEIVEPSQIPYEYMKAVPDVARIKQALTELRKELDDLDDHSLVDAAVEEGVLAPASAAAILKSDVGEHRNTLINGILKNRIPGTALVRGDDSLTILLPRRAKEDT